MGEGEQGHWEQVAATAYSDAGITVNPKQLASTARTLRRLAPVFDHGGPAAAGAESFASVLEHLAHD